MKLLKKTYRISFVSLICISFLLINAPAVAQDDAKQANKSLNAQEIDDLVDLAKYNKTVKKLKPKKRGEAGENKKDLKKVPEEEEETDFDLPSSGFSFGGGLILTGILYLIIAALVVFLIVAIFSSIKVDKKIKDKHIKKEEAIEDIEVIDAESGLELALKAENYREAVRMLFIKLLQVLVLEDSIKWKPEKTNRDYLKEMNKHSKIHHFNNLVIAYERIWYGRKPIDKLFFEYLRTDFEKFYSIEKVDIDVKE